ncbi:hypothetical protein EJ07DRAFT_159337 [Lizonia empirigonia]|nr:hypothetical protein EJ07DRAFT_159337 [Lizonia empirigonia]
MASHTDTCFPSARRRPQVLTGPHGTPCPSALGTCSRPAARRQPTRSRTTSDQFLMPPSHHGPLNPKRLLTKHRKSFEDSVDKGKPLTPVDGEWPTNQKCWEAKGPVLKEYEGLLQRLRAVVNRSCGTSGGEVAIDLFMVGKTPTRAKPIVILSSTDRKSRKAAREAVENGCILKDTAFSLGDKRYPPSGPLIPVGMEEKILSTASPHQVVYDPLEKIRLIGMPILIILESTGIMRRATANIVHDGTHFGYITAAHVLDKAAPEAPTSDDEDDMDMPFESDSDSDSDSNILDDDYDDRDEDTLSRYSNTSAEATETDSSSLLSPVTSRSQGSSVPPSQDPFSPGLDSPQEPPADLDKALPESSYTKVYEPLGTVSIVKTALDCMVITVTNAKVMFDLERLMRDGENHYIVTEAESPKSAQLIAWTSHGCVAGDLVRTPSLMRFVGSDSYELVLRFILREDGAIKLGDCGTWVTDAESRVPYGQVIAISRNGRLAYMVAIRPILQEIEKAGKWKLLKLTGKRSSNAMPSQKAVATGNLDEPFEKSHLKRHWLTSTANADGTELIEHHDVLRSVSNMNSIPRAFAICIQGYELLADSSYLESPFSPRDDFKVAMKSEEQRLLNWAKRIHLDHPELSLFWVPTAADILIRQAKVLTSFIRTNFSETTEEFIFGQTQRAQDGIDKTRRTQDSIDKIQRAQGGIDSTIIKNSLLFIGKSYLAPKRLQCQGVPYRADYLRMKLVDLNDRLAESLGSTRKLTLFEPLDPGERDILEDEINNREMGALGWLGGIDESQGEWR